jgi:hypothetical protein
MLMSGATGSVVDYLYGYTIACSKEVAASQAHYIQQKQQKQQEQQLQEIMMQPEQTMSTPNDKSDQ